MTTTRSRVPNLPKYDDLDTFLGCSGSCCRDPKPGTAVITGSDARALYARTRARNRGGI